MEEYAPMDLPDAAAAWRRDGFVVLPGYLNGPELEAAQRDLTAVYPSAEEYHAAPGEGRNRVYTGDEFGGIVSFPFPTVALCRVVVHDKLVALAVAFFGAEDIRIYAAELWAKYTGAVSYEQEHHRDYLNHTPLVPSTGDLRWRVGGPLIAPGLEPVRRAGHRAAAPALWLPPARSPLLDPRNPYPATSPVSRPRHTPVEDGTPTVRGTRRLTQALGHDAGPWSDVSWRRCAERRTVNMLGAGCG